MIIDRKENIGLYKGLGQRIQKAFPIDTALATAAGMIVNKRVCFLFSLINMVELLYLIAAL